MEPLLKNAMVVALCFSWPVGLQFAGEVTTFQVYFVTAITGLIYFGTMAGLGHIEVGNFSLWSTSVLTICGFMGAIGMWKYIPLLNTPKYAGMSLALTQVLVVFGIAFIIWRTTGNNTLTPTNALGVLVIATGVYLLLAK